jgi:hypothetical protein
MVLSLPGSGSCLHCTGFISPERARLDLMDETERGRHRARYGLPGTPQPSVIFLNATIVSLCVGELIKLVTGAATPASFVQYDAQRPFVQPLAAPQRDPNCAVCHREAQYARGDEPTLSALVRPVPDAEIPLRVAGGGPSREGAQPC